MGIKVEYLATNKAEGLLVNALQRLLHGIPQKVKSTGKLTLNKINNEAGFGNSYVHKFKKFVDYAKPVIDQYNENRDQSINVCLDLNPDAPLSQVDTLKAKLKKEEKLKKRYRTELDNAIVARKELEAENTRLLFRVLELQDKLKSEYKV